MVPFLLLKFGNAKTIFYTFLMEIIRPHFRTFIGMYTQIIYNLKAFYNVQTKKYVY